MRIFCAWVMVSVLGVVGLAGCNQMLAEKMVAPPNELRREISPAVTGKGEIVGADRELSIPVGPPNAVIAAWVLEPARGVTPKGTILVLHGILAQHAWVRKEAETLRAAGYRAVLVDLRGHGKSTGDHITYGVVESHDLVQVTDYLQKHQLAGEHIGVYGISYGASTAIQYAAVDPRVTVVVAVAAFASLRDEAPHFGRTLLPLPGLFLSDNDYTVILKAAGEVAGFDPDKASSLVAIGHTKARILLMHGDLDMVTPVENSIRLHAAAPETSELRILKGHGHMILALELIDSVSQWSKEWFEAHLVNAKDVVRVGAAN